MSLEGNYRRAVGTYKVLFITAGIGASISRLLCSLMRSAETDWVQCDPRQTAIWWVSSGKKTTRYFLRAVLRSYLCGYSAQSKPWVVETSEFSGLHRRNVSSSPKRRHNRTEICERMPASGSIEYNRNNQLTAQICG